MNAIWSKPAIRQRGFTLLEGILYIGLLGGVITFTANILQEETRKQENVIAASSLKNLMAANQNFVANEYDQLRQDLYDASGGGNDAIVSIGMDRLVTDGYLPAAFLNGGTTRNVFGQEYALVLRAVNRTDTNVPQATMDRGDLDPGNTGNIRPELTDDDPTNGEMEIESLLVTHDGNVEIGAARGGKILGAAGLQTVGFVNDTGRTQGNFGSFSMDISPFASLSTYPEAGQFASIISLSGFGVLSDGGSNQDADLGRALLRCADIDPITESSSYQTCVNSTENDIFGQIVFKSYQNNAGETVFPGIRGLKSIACDDAAPSVTDVDPDIMTIDCGKTSIVGDLEVTTNAQFGTQIAVGPTGAPQTILTADAITFNQDTIVSAVPNPDGSGGMETRIDGERIIMNGEDLRLSVTSSIIQPTETEVDKPVCSVDSDGVQLVPAIYVSPAAYADARGRSISGVRAFAQNGSTPGTWSVRMISFVSQDYCSAISGGQIVPIDPNGPLQFNGVPDNSQCSVFNADGSVAINRSDSLVDVYEVRQDYGTVNVTTRCIAP